MPADDISAQVSAWVQDEMNKQRFGEDFGWSVSWGPQPVPTPGGMVVIPVWQALITCRNPLLGQGELFLLVQLGAPRPKEDDVRRQIADGVRQLRELAASKLSGANGHRKAAIPG